MQKIIIKKIMILTKINSVRPLLQFVRYFTNKTHPKFSQNVGEKAIDFGAAKVTPQERTTLLQGIFKKNAEKYDLLGQVLTLGLEKNWRREVARKLGSLEGIYEKQGEDFKRRNIEIIDTCGGTGDLTFEILELAKNTRFYRESIFFSLIKSIKILIGNGIEMPINIKIVDMNTKMMEIGKNKASSLGFSSCIFIICNYFYKKS